MERSPHEMGETAVKLNLNYDDLDDVPIAAGGGVFFCPDPTCNNPHIVLVDDDAEPMAHYIVGPKFYAELKTAMEQKAGVEIAWPEKRFMLYGEVEALYLDAVAKSQIATDINKISDPNAMAVALDTIGKIQLANR